MRNISATFALARRKIKIPSTFHSQDNLKIFGIPHPYSCKIKADPVQSTSPDPGILLKINRNNMRKYFFSIYFCSSLFFHHTPNAFFARILSVLKPFFSALPCRHSQQQKNLQLNAYFLIGNKWHGKILF